MRRTDTVAALVRELGPVKGLYRLEEAEAIARQLALDKRLSGHEASAAGYEAAAQTLLGQQYELVKRFG